MAPAGGVASGDVAGGSRGGTLEQALRARRLRALVGRRAEVELFEAALAADEPPFSVLYLHGPGGIGKSTLLDVLAARAEASGAAVVRVDGRSVVPNRGGVVAALAAHLDGVEGGGPVAHPSGARLVLVVDAVERLAPLDGWLRDDLLPRLPASTVTVLAGRAAPGAGWRADAAWRELLRVVALRNLGPDEARAYLAGGGVDPGLHDRVLALTHGHPLALSLVADLVVRGGAPALDPPPPDVVASLLRCFLDVVPTPQQRRALEVCALARATTEDLLRDVLAVDDAHPVFEWLRDLSFVEAGPDGLLPHDLARDVLDVELRWRDPEAYRQVFRAVRAHIHRRLGELDGIEQQRAIFDEKFVFRNLPSVLSPVDWEAWGESYPEPAQPGDREAVIGLVAAAEGPRSAAIAEAWWQRQPRAFHVVRDQRGDVRGMLALVRLYDGSTVEGPDFDPGARAAWDHAQRTAPPRPGEVVTQTRFVVDRDRYQAPSPTLNATPILTMQRYLQLPDLAWDFLTLADPDPLDDYFALADLPRAVGGDFVVGGRTFGLFAHDFRTVPVHTWLEVVTERALAQEVSPPPAAAPDVVVLSQEAFADAARQALRDLLRSDLLAGNPLCRSRLVAQRSGGGATGSDVLAEVVLEAVGSLRAHPRDVKRWRALHRTYLEPAGTQEQAAEALGLPFSTYRRHLTEGVERVVSLLWRDELHGGPAPLHRS